MRCCHKCQLDDPIQTDAPALYPIKVVSFLFSSSRWFAFFQEKKHSSMYPSAKCRLYKFEAFFQVTDPWTVVGLDLVGPLKETPRGHKYIMSMTDLYTKWVAAAPLPSKTAWEVCWALVRILYSFGLTENHPRPREGVCERGEKLFTSGGIIRCQPQTYIVCPTLY